MIVLDANILIRAVLGRRVRQLIETYGSRGARFFAPDVAFADAARYLPSLRRGGPPWRHLESDVPRLSEKTVPATRPDRSIFSAVKRPLSSRAPGRSLATQIRQALLLGLAYNLYRLRHRFAQTGCQ